MLRTPLQRRFFPLIFAGIIMLAGSVRSYAVSETNTCDKTVAVANTATGYLAAAYNVIWAENLRRQVSFLSDEICQGRATGTRGNVEAGFWIASEFARLGLMPLDGDNICCGTSYARHCEIATPIKRGKETDTLRVPGHNFAAMLPASTKSHKDKYIIIGAHYDGIGTIGEKLYPGADSNASGTVAMLSLAKMFTTMRLFGSSWSVNIIFVAFDAKELSMSGSNAFWHDLTDGHISDPVSGKAIKPSDISMMVNIDQIGGISEPLHKGRNNFIIMLGNNSLPKESRSLAAAANRACGQNIDLGLSYYGSDRFTTLFYRLSDQRIFVDHGVPAILFTSGITMTTNKTSDTPDTLDYEVLRSRIIFIFTWLNKII